MGSSAAAAVMLNAGVVLSSIVLVCLFLFIVLLRDLSAEVPRRLFRQWTRIGGFWGNSAFEARRIIAPRVAVNSWPCCTRRIFQIRSSGRPLHSQGIGG